MVPLETGDSPQAYPQKVPFATLWLFCVIALGLGLGQMELKRMGIVSLALKRGDKMVMASQAIQGQAIFWL